MQIIVDIYPDEDGRPAGTVRAAASSDARPFSGNLEFLALIESLYRTEDRSSPPPSTPPAKGTDP
jgi:hypothetical protein